MKLIDGVKAMVGLAVAVLVTYLFGTIFVSQGNIGAVVQMGYEVSFAQRLNAMFHDMTHMHDLFLPLVAIGLLIALGVAALIIRFYPHLRLVGYVSAGFVSMIALHLILKAVLGLSGIAPTRELTGLIAQGLAGAAGGFVFHWITAARG